MQEIISRSSYLEEVERYLHKQTIVVLRGQRRVGKSFGVSAFSFFIR